MTRNRILRKKINRLLADLSFVALVQESPFLFYLVTFLVTFLCASLEPLILLAFSAIKRVQVPSSAFLLNGWKP